MNGKESDIDSRAQKRTWEDIVRLAKGTTNDKKKAAVLIIENSSTMPGEPSRLPPEAWEIVKQLAQADQPEEVRIELAKALKSENIAIGLRDDLQGILKKDPSELVREQARVSLEEADMRDMRFYKLGIAREIRPKWWWVSRLKSYLAERKLEFAVIISLAIGAVVASWTRNLDIQRSSLDTLTQANATVFALIFTIPLAAAQFSRYKISPESFFDAKNIAFFSLYGLAVLLPMVVYDRSWSPLFIGLSATCMALVFPFLFRVAEILRSASIVNHSKTRIRKRWSRGKLTAAVELEYLAYQALSSKDYDTFSNVIYSLCDLIPVWKNTYIKFSLHPLQLDVAGLESTLRRVGEASLDDLNGLKIYCYGVLSTCTFKRFDIGKEVTFEKDFEFKLLSALARRTKVSEDSLRIILQYLVGWCVQSRYVDKQDQTRAIMESAYTLLQHPDELVSEILEQVRKQIGLSPLFLQYLFPEVDVYTLSGSYHPVIRYHTRKMLSRLELEIDELRAARKIESHAPAQAVDVDILPATEVDARQILALQKIAYRDDAVAYDDYLILPLSETLEEVTREFGRKHFLKAIVGDTIIGSVRGELDGATCRITRLMVHPSFRNVNLEERLVTSIESNFPNAPHFEALVYDKSPNETVYRKLGYQISNKIELSDKIAMICLEKHRPI